jgi:hypothetical protein
MMVWNRVLSQQEIQQLVKNPMQVFQGPNMICKCIVCQKNVVVVTENESHFEHHICISHSKGQHNLEYPMLRVCESCWEEIAPTDFINAMKPTEKPPEFLKPTIAKTRLNKNHPLSKGLVSWDLFNDPPPEKK